MKFNISKKTIIPDSFKWQYVKWKFDIDWEEFNDSFEWEIPIEWLDWSIWVIVGPSWTWKSTIAKELFWDKFIDFNYWNKAVIDELDWNIDEIIDIFNKVWFNTPKSRLKPYNVLSNWEKMRVDLCKALLSKNDIVIFDEYTSVVDRVVAQVSSYALSKNIRKNNKKFIAVSCHYDILERLEPDWIFDTKTFTFIKGMKSPNTKDLQLNVKSETEVYPNGRYLWSIII